MVATIRSFPLPGTYQPAQTRPDDARSVANFRRVFTDEERMRALIADIDKTRLGDVDAAVEPVRARLPLFPACFKEWELEKSSNNRLSGCAID
jgi:hypothetical protein